MNKKLHVLIFISFIFTLNIFSQSDDCDSSISGTQLTVGSSCVTTPFNSINATDYWDSNYTCNAADRDDAWGWFTATSASTTISYNPDSRDAILTLFPATCNPNMTSLACADDFGAGGTETIVFATVASTVYNIRIQRFNSNNDMSGTICVYNTPAPPANDACSGAISLTPNTNCTPTTGSTTNATDNNEIGDCTVGTENAVWYSFTATSTSHNVIVDGIIGFNAVVGVISSCGSTTRPTGGTCTNITGSGGIETLNLTGLTPTNTYYVQVYDFDGDQTANGFTICITTPPPNDSCNSAITLTPNATCIPTSSTTLGASYSGPVGCTGTADDDVWFSFTATSTDHTIIASEGTINDIVFEIFVGTCGSLTSVLCVDNFIGGTDEFGIISGFTIGTTYLIRVYSFANGTDQGSFDICIITPTPPATPPNDICSTATQLDCEDINIAGTTNLSSNTPHGTSCSMSNYGVWYTFIGDGNQTTIIVTPEAGFDPEMAIVSSSSNCSGTFTSIACEDDNIDGIVESYTFDTVSGTNYYIYIADYFAGASSAFTGNFTISRTCVDTCNPTSTPNHSDLACPSVIAAEATTGNNPISLNYCNVASVDLEATYLDIGDTTSYAVTDISGTEPPYNYGCLANQVSIDQDDIWSSTVNLPFNFCFYGQTYNSCVIGANGVISFNTGLAGLYSAWATFENVPHLTENAYEVIFPFRYQFHYGASIYGVHNDIDPRFGGEVGYELITLDTGCRALVASWNEVPMFLNANAGDLSKRFTSMIVLYEDTNVIEVYIKEKVLDDETSPGVLWNDGNASVAIQNANGTQGLSPAGRNIQNANWTATNEAYRFTPDGGTITSLTWYEGSGTGGTNLGSSDIISVSPVVPTTYTAAVTYTLCDASIITVTDEVIVNPSGKIWLGGDVSVGPNTDPEDWMNPENWLGNSVPTITDCVIIPSRPNDPIIYDGDSGYGDFMRIFNGATLTLQNDTAVSPPFSGTSTASTLTIQDFIDNEGVFNIQDDASLVQINNVNNTGSGTVNIIRESIINDNSDYVYWSTPIAGFDIGTIPGDLTYQWTPTIPANGIGRHGNWQGASGAMDIGKGYIKRASTTPSITATFTSTNNNLNNGNYSPAITSGNYTGGDYNTSGSTADATLDDDNWNLLGNPYPSSIDATKFLAANLNLAGFINIWTHGTPIGNTGDPFYYDFGDNYTISDYIAYNGSGPQIQNGFHGNIASGQGFMVLMNHAGSTYPNNSNVTFSNDMRYSGVSPYTHYGNNQFFRTSSSSQNSNAEIPEERHRIWLGLISPIENAYSTLVAYTEHATMQKDRMYDAETNLANAMNIYSMIDNSRMVIQGRSLPFNQEDQVPMGIITTTSGVHTIAITGVDGLFDNDSQNIYLEDLELNIIHDLREQPYTFTVEPGQYDQRFVLRYTTNSLSVDEFNSLKGLTISAPNSDYIKISSTSEPIDSVVVFDLLGRNLLTQNNVNTNELILDTVSQSDGVLLVKVTLTNGQQKIQKVVLRH